MDNIIYSFILNNNNTNNKYGFIVHDKYLWPVLFIFLNTTTTTAIIIITNMQNSV